MDPNLLQALLGGSQTQASEQDMHAYYKSMYDAFAGNPEMQTQAVLSYFDYISPESRAKRQKSQDFAKMFLGNTRQSKIQRDPSTGKVYDAASGMEIDRMTGKVMGQSDTQVPEMANSETFLNAMLRDNPSFSQLKNSKYGGVLDNAASQMSNTYNIQQLENLPDELLNSLEVETMDDNTAAGRLGRIGRAVTSPITGVAEMVSKGSDISNQFGNIRNKISQLASQKPLSLEELNKNRVSKGMSTLSSDDYEQTYLPGFNKVLGGYGNTQTPEALKALFR